MKVCIHKYFIVMGIVVFPFSWLSYAEENTAVIEAIGSTPVQKEKGVEKEKVKSSVIDAYSEKGSTDPKVTHGKAQKRIQEKGAVHKLSQGISSGEKAQKADKQKEEELRSVLNSVYEDKIFGKNALGTQGDTESTLANLEEKSDREKEDIKPISSIHQKEPSKGKRPPDKEPPDKGPPDKGPPDKGPPDKGPP